MYKFYITTTIPGTFEFFLGQMKLWSKEFDVCAISSMRSRLESIGKHEGIRTHYIDMTRNPSPLKDLNSFFHFLYLFFKDRPDIVHGGTPKASLLSMTAAWLTRRPIRIYMCHGLRYQAFSGMKRKFLMFMEKISCWCATDVICVSFGTRDGLITDGLCSSSKARVIGHGSPCGIDLSHYNPSNISNIEQLKNELNIKENDFVFLFIGRLVHDKGVNELVSSFKKINQIHPNTHLVMLGMMHQELDPIKQSTLDEIEKNPSISYLGQKSDIRPYLVLSDIFVLPSYREGLSTVLVEAGAMSKASITCDVTGCREIIDNGENGFLIKARDEESLYTAMLYAYDHPEEVKKMSLKARKIIEERYEQNRVWEGYLEEYRRLVKTLK